MYEKNCTCKIIVLFSDVETSLLIIVLDTNPAQRIIIEDPYKLQHCVECVIAFANSHLMLNPINKLAVISSNTESRYIYVSLFYSLVL